VRNNKTLADEPENAVMLSGGVKQGSFFGRISGAEKDLCSNDKLHGAVSHVDAQVPPSHRSKTLDNDKLMSVKYAEQTASPSVGVGLVQRPVTPSQVVQK
jgi:hypothetical protein